jgi:hypothetical protein
MCSSWLIEHTGDFTSEPLIAVRRNNDELSRYCSLRVHENQVKSNIPCV